MINVDTKDLMEDTHLTFNIARNGSATANFMYLIREFINHGFSSYVIDST